jgi:hypothetical protein
MLLPPPRPLAEVAAALRHARPRCVLHAASRSDHVMQIFAGLHALHARGWIRLARRNAGEDVAGVQVEVEGAGPVFFDVRDGPDLYPAVEHVRLYAKRSFRPGLPAHCIPLGLNYALHPRPLGVLARRAPILYRAVGMPSARPPVDLAPRALFLARTWDPAEVPGLRRVDVLALNDARAECIRTLRSTFGERFLGGFARSAYTLRHYPDCAAPESISTRRRDYLKLLRSFPVGVATRGLSDSIGWKFAEYVALARAIVSEPLRYEVPGPLAAGANYLEFATPAACVEQVGTLLEDRDARARMMARNADYFREYATPAAVVARVLHTALLRA